MDLDLERSRIGGGRSLDDDFVSKITFRNDMKSDAIPKTTVSMSPVLKKLHEDSKRACVKTVNLDMDYLVWRELKKYMDFTMKHLGGKSRISQSTLQQSNDVAEPKADMKLPLARAAHYLELKVIYDLLRGYVVETFDRCSSKEELKTAFQIDDKCRHRLKSVTVVGLETKPLKFPDPQESTCYMCQKKDSLGSGNRHTCRKCFHVICSDHTERGIMPVTEKARAEAVIDRHVLSKVGDAIKSPMKWMVGTDPGETKVCGHCYNRLDKEIVSLVKEFAACFDLPRLQKIIDLAPCPLWATAAQICLSDLFSLQHRLPTHRLQANEQWLLLFNRQHLACHSAWSFLVLTAMSANNYPEKEALKFVDCDPSNRIPCDQVGCFKQCSKIDERCLVDFFVLHPGLRIKLSLSRPRLSFMNAILLIADFQSINYPEIRKRAVHVLQTETPKDMPIDREVALSIYLPLLAHALSLEETPQSSELFNLLCLQATVDITFRTDLYWWLRVQGEAEGALGRKFRRLHSMMIAKLAAGHSVESSMHVIYSQQLVDAIHEAACASRNGGITDPASSAMAVKRKLKEECEDLPLNQKGGFLPLPLFPHQHVVGIDIEKVKVMSSNIKPIVVPLKVQDARDNENSEADGDLDAQQDLGSSNISRETINGKTETLRILYKLEDVRKDSVACRLINLMIGCVPFAAIEQSMRQEKYFRDNPDAIPPNIRQYLISYKVVPVSAESGMIEWVENATTIYDIGKGEAGHFGLMKFLQTSPGPGEPHYEIKKYIFTCTLAIYTVFSYLLGAGDRHKGNLMISQLGSFFHIDFGWLLGEDPKPRYMTRRLAISREMIEVIGREDGEQYQLLETVASKVFNSLRQHYREISTLLLFLKLTKPAVDIKYSATQIEDELAARFAVGIPDDQADRVIRKWIHDEVVTNRYAVDTIHSMAQSATTVIPGVVAGVGLITGVLTQGVNEAVRAVQRVITLTRPINGLQAIANDLDIFLFDQHGTLHDGIQAYKEAANCLKELQATKKEIVILSKSKQTGDKYKQSFDMRGFTGVDLGRITFLTYGNITYDAICSKIQRRSYCYALVSDDNKNICEDLAKKLEIKFTTNIEKADFLYVCGTSGVYKSPTEIVKCESMLRPELLIPFLCQCLEKNKMMFVGGPDLPDVSVKQPSEVADMYEQCRADNDKTPRHKDQQDFTNVIRTNTKEAQMKSYLEKVKRRGGNPRMVMVGDTLLSDILPAKNIGIKTVFITSGNEEEIDLDPGQELSNQKAKLSDFFTKNGVEPTFCVQKLCY